MSLQPKPDECLCCCPKEQIGNSFHYEVKDKSVCRCFLLISKKLFLAMYLSGRTMELDKLYEPEHDDQSSAASEMVPEAATTIMASMTTKGFSHGNRSTY